MSDWGIRPDARFFVLDGSIQSTVLNCPAVLIFELEGFPASASDGPYSASASGGRLS